MKIRVLVAILLGLLLAASLLITYGSAQEGDVDTLTAELEAGEYSLVQTPLLASEACSVGRQGGTPDDVLYFWDFEGSNGGFVGTLDWEWGTYAWAGTCATYYEPPAAYSGTDMWGTVLNGCYNNLGNNSGYNTCINGNPADDSILSFTLDLTGVTDPVEMSWWEWYDLFMPWDWGEVYANGNVVFQHCGGSYVIPTAWEQQVVDLTPYIGGLVNIEFHMMASTVVERAGWWIDDVMIYTVAKPNIIVDAPPLETGLCPNASEMITFTICNTGTAPLVWGLSEITGTHTLAPFAPDDIGGCNSSGTIAYNNERLMVYSPVQDVPWLSEVPTNGVLGPDLCEVVDVTFNATGMMPGEYLADLIINSNDPLSPSITLPATMTVWAPAEILDVIYAIDSLTVTFDAQVAGDGPLTYNWDFGDSNTSDLEDPVHTYYQGGCYLVTLDVNSTCGMDTWSAEICLCESVAGTDFTWMPTMPVVDEMVYFTATEPLTGTAPFTYTWDFDDGLYGEGITATHVYTAAGNYDITLLVENACGETMVTDTVTIIPACDPVSGLSFSWSPAAVGETVFFTATQPSTGTPPFTYSWDFGDGVFGEGITATHVYTAAGDYEVTLTVQNACGEDSTTHTVTVEILIHYTYLPVVVRGE